MTIDKDEFNPSGSTRGEIIYRIVRGATGSIPVAGPAAVELLQSVVEDPFQARRTRWLEELSACINNAVDDVEELKRNQSHMGKILSAILASTDIALQKGEIGLHQRLLNAVVRTVKNSDIEEDLMTLYFTTIRQLTRSHFNVLEHYLTLPPVEKTERNTREVEAEFLHELSGKRLVADKAMLLRVLRDIETLGLIENKENSTVSLAGTNYHAKRATEFGQGLLAYVGDI